MEDIIEELTEKVQAHKHKVERKTISVRELADILGVSYNKANILTHRNDAPVLVIGRTRRIIISKIDSWLDNMIGCEL
ncbi:Uncharacterised protein [Sarcina ventriculi]|uniref:helix-turn-helix domain-containing protein n=1 Tax=Sarcina ventriculi TaxID=1267 RepID=UPI000D8AD68C|nr:helix-turn-helix domain-containing protein [Sarcina ventriculi]SPZ49724.1 Uncharacterised protein [Sarcina ventriculi]